MKRLGRLGVAIAIALTAMMVSTTTASAQNPGDVVITGGGSISPGLSLTATNQSVTFSGTATGVIVAGGGVFAGSANCGPFTGNSVVAETVLLGQGKVAGVCVGVDLLGRSVTADCTIEYRRVGPTVIITGTCSVTVTPPGVTVTVTVVGEFVFIATTVNPVTSYQLVGNVTLV